MGGKLPLPIFEHNYLVYCFISMHYKFWHFFSRLSMKGEGLWGWFYPHVPTFLCNFNIFTNFQRRQIRNVTQLKFNPMCKILTFTLKTRFHLIYEEEMCKFWKKVCNNQYFITSILLPANNIDTGICNSLNIQLKT